MTDYDIRLVLLQNAVTSALRAMALGESTESDTLLVKLMQEKFPQMFNLGLMNNLETFNGKQDGSYKRLSGLFPDEAKAFRTVHGRTVEMDSSKALALFSAMP